MLGSGEGWVLAKYILFQIPGWGMAGGLAWWAHHSWGVPSLWAVGGVCLFVVKDAVLYPFVKKAYSVAPGKGAAPEPGTEVVVTDDLDPKGFVRVGAELWKAEILVHHAPLRSGSSATIRSVEGLTLIVEAGGPASTSRE